MYLYPLRVYNMNGVRTYNPEIVIIPQPHTIVLIVQRYLLGVQAKPPGVSKPSCKPPIYQGFQDTRKTHPQPARLSLP